MSLGRRERNKAEKLERIMSAASALFADHGIEDVTTQQVADAADIGTGTLFLYAKTKGELLLMVQNAHYAESLASGQEAAESIEDPVEAVMAIAGPIVACNRTHVGNGRVYLREMVFGEATDGHRTEALRIQAMTDEATASIIARSGADLDTAGRTARLISAAMLLTMVGAPPEAGLDDVLADLEVTVRLLVAGPGDRMGRAPRSDT